MSEPGVIRKRRSRVEVEKLVSEYAAGGLTRVAFCEQRDLSVAALDKYRRRVQKWARSGAARMLPLEVISSTVQDSNRDDGRDGVAAILSVIESCRRLKIPARDYLADILPGLANTSLQRIADLAPEAWAAKTSPMHLV